MLEQLIETIDYIEDHLLDDAVIDNALGNIKAALKKHLLLSDRNIIE